MIDPGGWAENLGAGIAGMMMTRRTGTRPDNGGDDFPSEAEATRSRDALTVETLRRWAHPTVTMGILLFAFQQYEAAQNWRRETEKQIAVLQERIEEGKAVNAAQDATAHAALAGITSRLDVQRDDIRKLQQQQLDHASRDEQRFRDRR
jgi:hypothetical protein